MIYLWGCSTTWHTIGLHRTIGMGSFLVFPVSLSIAKAGAAVETPGPNQVDSKWTWEDLEPEGGLAIIRGQRSIFFTAHLLCFRYFLCILRFDAVPTSYASQFLLCPVRAGIYPSPVCGTFTELLLCVRQPSMFPVFLYCYCYFLSSFVAYTSLCLLINIYTNTKS